MIRAERMTELEDLTDELLVLSVLLAIMATPSDRAPVLLAMCAASVERCQHHVERLVRSERENSWDKP